MKERIKVYSVTSSIDQTPSARNRLKLPTARYKKTFARLSTIVEVWGSFPKWMKPSKYLSFAGLGFPFNQHRYRGAPSSSHLRMRVA
jgi:hypothetical protein